ncbi:hypothetical protein Q4I28_001770 [Leishmania naiffi]|uniref:RING-type domain-containing protein n=1 Tax=Leishmania naiffi TaxID=5678 RepID=A0AAW3C4N9_9TRYP
MSFQPICVLCLSDCDRGGGVTSCNHYLCSRCAARLPTAAPCPLCQRPYQLIKLDHPNVQQLLQDGATALERTEKVISSQMRHYQQVIRRMRQALAMLHSQNQEMSRRRQQEQTECAAAVSRAQALQAEVCRLREDLTRASSKRAASQQQPPPLPPSPPQQRAHVMADPRVTHDSDGHPHNAPNTLGVCHTPSAQIIPPPLAVRHAPFASTSAVGAKAPDTFSRGSWQRPSGASSPSLSSHPQWQHRRHHSHGNGGEVRDAAVESAPPLGWSASSLIAKRHRADSDPSLSQGRVGDVCVSLAQPGASSNAGRNVALTPRTHALASLQHQLPHQSSRAAAWGPGSGDGSDSAGPRVDFRLTTPLAAALHQQPQPQPQPSHPLNSFMQAGTSYLLRPSLKPHQRLFSSPRDGPVSL